MLIQIIRNLVQRCIISQYRRYRSFYLASKHKLGTNVIIGKNCIIAMGVKIDDYTYINDGVRIDANTNYIGKYCSISHNVKIGLGPHPADYVSTSPVFYSKARGFTSEDNYDEYQAKGYTNIEHDVLIGANAVVLAGVTIGTGAIVGACSLVNKDVPPYAIVGGIPAKIIGYRFDAELIELLMASEWWNQDIEILLKCKHLIDKPREFLIAVLKHSKKGEN